MKMAEQTPVDRFFTEASVILEALPDTEPSLRITANDNFRKSLLLAAASYFEKRICDIVLEFVRERSKGSVLLEEFVRNKAITRQYHTWFDWEKNNANRFYSLFGKSFSEMMRERVKQIGGLQDSERAFLEVGNERNKLVHQDYVTFLLNKTMDEIYQCYRKALDFVEILPAALRECDNCSDES